jgi:hypothetical protein
MLTAHELIGFMSPALGGEILSASFELDKPLYRATLNAVAEARKVRPIFMERQPRAQRHEAMLSVLSRPVMDAVSANLIRNWLVKKQTAMLVQFLNALDIPHKDGVVDDLPKSVEDAKLTAAVEGLLAKYPQETVAVYLVAFHDLNEANWPNLKAMLDKDPRLQLGNHA